MYYYDTLYFVLTLKGEVEVFIFIYLFLIKGFFFYVVLAVEWHLKVQFSIFKKICKNKIFVIQWTNTRPFHRSPEASCINFAYISKPNVWKPCQFYKHYTLWTVHFTNLNFENENAFACLNIWHHATIYRKIMLSA